MFTGIVEETGRVIRIAPSEKSIGLEIESKVCSRAIKRGDSLAVNGCCLTVALARGGPRRKLLKFDLLRETWARTNFKALRIGRPVNLERPLRADARLGGHFVTGHVDGTGKIAVWEKRGADWFLEISPPRALLEFLIEKGSIAIDGISLTVAAVTRNRFQVWIIPHTLEVTNLAERKVGDEVNLEADILGKYVKQFVRRGRGKRD